MANSDNTLEMFIKLGVVGKEDVKAAADLFDENKKAVFGLSEAATGLGEALTKSFSGALGPGNLALTVYDKAHEKLDQINADLDKQGEAAAKPLGAGVAGVRQSWQEAAESLGKYNSTPATAGKDNDPIGTEIKRAKEVAEAKIEAEKVTEAKGKQEEETLRQKNASSDEIAAAHARTQAKLDALDEQKQEATGSGSLKSEQAERDAQNEKLHKNAIDATEAARQAKAKHLNDVAVSEKANRALDPTSDEAKALQKRVTDATAELAHANLQPDNVYSLGSFGGVPIDQHESKERSIVDAKTDLDAANSAVEEAKKLAEREQTNAAASNTLAYETSQTQAKDAQAASEHNQERLTQLPGEIGQAQKLEQIQKDAAAQITAAQAATPSIPNTPSQNPDNKTGGVQGEPSGGNENSVTRLEELNNNHLLNDRLNTLLATISANQETMIGLINNSMTSQLGIVSEVQSLKSKYSTLQSQVHELQSSGTR